MSTNAKITVGAAVLGAAAGYFLGGGTGAVIGAIAGAVLGAAGSYGFDALKESVQGGNNKGGEQGTDTDQG